VEFESPYVAERRRIEARGGNEAPWSTVSNSKSSPSRNKGRHSPAKTSSPGPRSVDKEDDGFWNYQETSSAPKKRNLEYIGSWGNPNPSSTSVPLNP
jgi:hypothetical protein